MTRPPADIFIIDDDPLVTTSLGRLLELETPHRVTAFSSGAHALSVMKHSPPELVISDLSMPGMDGVELLKRARALRPDGARIILTGYADKESAIRAINEAGIFMFVEKPWDNQSLLITVDNALNQVALTQELNGTISKLTARNVELERALAELRDAQDRLVAAERLAAVGRLASGIAHEMGNQLSLLAFTDLLAERYGGDAEGKKLIDPVIAVRKRLGSMLGTLRDYVRGAGAASYARDTQPLTPVVDEAIDILRFDPARKGREITRSPWDPTVTASVNREKILQVVINLLRNAFQATREGGHIRAGVSRQGDRAVVEIADDGVGIAPADLERIWEPFFTTKGDTGTGLGLGISRRILEEHGGTLRAASHPGEGATFTIELPTGA
jgi:signal transduction histidine kinase